MDENEDWEEEKIIRPAYIPKSYSPGVPGKRHLQLVSQQPEWKSPLNTLREAFQTQLNEKKGHWPATRQILYFIDVSATLEGKGLVIEVADRDIKKNGEWGQLKSHSDLYGKPQNLPDPEDRCIIALLLGSRDATGYYYDYPGYYGRGSFRRILPGPALEYLMKLLCRTGRCFLRKTPSSSCETPLRWDDGDAWEVCLHVEKDGSGQNYVLKGCLQRGPEQVGLGKPSLLVAGGLVFFEDSVSRLLDRGTFGWISILRKQRSLIVPIKDGDALIQELMSISVLPRLFLPDELKYEEIHVTPRPQLTVVAPKGRNTWEANWLKWELSFDYNGHIIDYDNPGRGILIAEPHRFLMRDQ